MKNTPNQQMPRVRTTKWKLSSIYCLFIKRDMLLEGNIYRRNLETDVKKEVFTENRRSKSPPYTSGVHEILQIEEA